MADNTETSSLSPLTRHAGALLIIAMLSTFGALMAYGSTLKVTNPWVIGCLIIGFAALGGWFAGRSQGGVVARDQWSKQRTMMGVNALTSSLLFFLLLVGVNYVAARRHKTFDITKNKVNSLADQTLKQIGQLKDKVSLTYVYAPAMTMRGPAPQDADLLDKYKFASDNIRVKYVDAFAEPGELKALNLGSSFTGRPLVVVQSDKGATDTNANRQIVDTIDESNLTSALGKLGDSKTRVLYFLLGHGESSLDSATQRQGFGMAKARLESQGYRLQSLQLTGSKKIPTDAALVVAMGPRDDLSDGEAATLQSYLKGKGRLLLALSLSERPLKNWYAVAKSAGANVINGFVVDPEQFVQSPQYVIGPVIDPTKHPVLGGVGENTNVVFPGVTPLKAVTPAPAGLTITTLLESSPSSQSAPFARGGVSEKGPFALAIAAERGGTPPGGAPGTPPASSMRAIVIANAQFGADTFYNNYANGNFLLSCVNWVAGNDLLVSIPPKPPVTNTITMTPGVRRFAAILSIFTLPLAILMMGGVMWWRRR